MVRVELYGQFAEWAGRVVTVEIALPASLTALAFAMATQHPILAKALSQPRTRFCVNDAVVTGEMMVQTGDNVALFPPVSGG